jgi:hypothetical protein
MKSIAAHWRVFRDKAYPGGMVADQNRQLHQAFFAGAFVALQESQKLADLPEDTAVASLHAMIVETETFCEAAAKAGKAKLS